MFLFIDNNKSVNTYKCNIKNIKINKRTVKYYELFGLAYVLGIDINDLLADMKKNFKK